MKPATLAVKGGITGREMACKFGLKEAVNANFRVLLHAANLRHGKERLLLPLRGKGDEDFFALKKIRRLLSGLNPKTWVPKANTLLLDHRRRFGNIY
jgi:hypothetical protein